MENLNRKYEFSMNVEQLDNVFSTGAKFSTKDVKTGELHIQLTKSRNIINLNETLCYANILKPDGEVIAHECEVIDAEKGIVKLDLVTDAMNQPGLYNFEIVVTNSEEKLVTPTMQYQCYESLNDGDKIEASNEFGLLEKALIKVDLLRSEFEALYENLERNEGTRVSNESIRTQNENQRQTNESNRVLSEQNRQTSFNKMVQDNNSYKDEIKNVINEFKENINSDFDNYKKGINSDIFDDNKIDFFGKEHDSMKHRLNSDFDNLHQRINDSSLLPYEGTSIKADNTYYGLTKEATVKGRTLQNLVGDFLKTDNNASYENGVGILPNPNCNVYFGNDLLKSDTVYTCLINVVQYDCSEKIKIVLVSGNGSGLGFCELTPRDVGLVRLKISGTEKNHFKIVIWRRTGDSEGVFKFKDFMVLEGDHTNTPIEELPFVEGIQGTGDLSKNLFNIKSATSGHIRADGTLNASATNNIASIKMNVTSSKLYAQTIGGHQNGGYFSFYDSNDTFISTTYRTNNAEMIVPSNAKKFIFHTQYFNAITDYSEEAFNNANIMVSTEPIDKQLPYYDGYKVSGKSCGKNLINCSEWSKTSEATVNANEDGSFTLTTLSSWKGIIFKNIKLKSNTTYTLNCKSSQSNIGMYVRVKKSNGNYNAQADWGGKLPAKFTTGNNAPIVQVTIETITALENVIISEIQLEENTVATTYEPYQESTYSYILDEPLRQLPNGVADSINLETGVLTRRVGKLILDGTNRTFTSYNEQCFENTNYYSHSIGQVANSQSCINNLLPSQVAWNNDNVEACIVNSTRTHIHIRILKSKLNAYGGSINKYLQANTITLYFELEKPKEMQLNQIQLKSFEGTTHIMSNNTLQATTSVKIPSNVQMVVQNLRAENKALNVELKDTKAELENTDLDILEMNWETDFRVCELEYVIYSQEARAVSLKTNSRAISKYDQAKTLIEANRYNKTTMTRQLTVYLERGYITEEEYNELMELMNC